MKKNLLKLNLLICLCLPLIGFAQIQVTDLNSASITPASLVNGFTGSGIQILNVTPIGNNQQMGYFQGSNNSGLSNGIIFSTGNVNAATGPNSLTGTGTNFNASGDLDLDTISTFPTNDAAGLEISFIPTGGVISFNYVFASEEYPEWVGSAFNDIFAFFISGPGLPKQNIALIPNTTLPVSINNVNASSNANYYIDNSTGTDLEYDGHTTILNATIALIPNQTYTLKLVIADVGDGNIDSGVLLEFGSFSSPTGGFTAAAYTPDFSGEIQEGCANGNFSFLLSDTLTADTTIHYSIIGSAQNGIDYLPIADSITIPAGQQLGMIPIIAIDDNITEGLEDVSISVDNGLGGFDTLTISINDPNLPQLLYSDTTVCLVDSLVIGYTGGDLAFYNWLPASSVACSSCPATALFDNTSAAYIGSYTTTKGCIGIDTVLVNVVQPSEPFVTCMPLGIDSLLVNWTTSTLPLSCEIKVGTSSWVTPNNGFNSHIVTGYPPQSNLSILVRCTNLCGVVAIDTASCMMPCDLAASFNVVNDSVGLGLGSITTTITGGTAPYSINWSNGTPNNLTQGWYYVTITDSGNCSLEDSVYIDNTTNTHTIFDQHDLKIYPNPVDNYVMIDWNFPNQINLNLQLMAVDGRLIQAITLPSRSNQHKISTTNLPNGVYWLKVIHENDFTVRKIVVTH